MLSSRLCVGFPSGSLFSGFIIEISRNCKYATAFSSMTSRQYSTETNVADVS